MTVTMMIETPKTVAAIRKAADFLEANPDKRTVGTFARRADGEYCAPRSPEATCWCALGRMLVELDNDAYDRVVEATTSEVGEGNEFSKVEYLLDWDTSDSIWTHNDDRRGAEKTAEVVAHMRQVADELEATATA